MIETSEDTSPVPATEEIIEQDVAVHEDVLMHMSENELGAIDLGDLDNLSGLIRQLHMGGILVFDDADEGIVFYSES